MRHKIEPEEQQQQAAEKNTPATCRAEQCGGAQENQDQECRPGNPALPSGAPRVLGQARFPLQRNNRPNQNQHQQRSRKLEASGAPGGAGEDRKPKRRQQRGDRQHQDHKFHGVAEKADAGKAEPQTAIKQGAVAQSHDQAQQQEAGQCAHAPVPEASDGHYSEQDGANACVIGGGPVLTVLKKHALGRRGSEQRHQEVGPAPEGHGPVVGGSAVTSVAL